MHAAGVSALVLGLVLITSPSWASDEEERARVYIGVLGVASWPVRVADEFDNSLVETETSSSPAYGAALTYGVRIEQPFAFEIDFEWTSGYEIDQTTAVGKVSDKIITYTLTSNMAYHPLDQWFDPFVSVGAGWMRAELDDFGATGDGLALRFAAGSDFWMTDNLGLRIEGRYTLPVSKGIEDLDLVGPRVGLFYRF